MEPEQQVALLSLQYRACHLNRHSGPDGVLEDIECCPGEVSLATLAASDSFTWQDWRIVAILDQPEHLLQAAQALAADGDAIRAEALLHALPPCGLLSCERWASPFRGGRWRKVERAMRAISAEGITASRDDIESVAVSAYRALTGNTHEDYMDEYADTLFAGHADA